MLGAAVMIETGFLQQPRHAMIVFGRDDDERVGGDDRRS